MKKLILFLVIAGFITKIKAQEMGALIVPVRVTTAFTQDYPSIKNAYWTKDGNNFVANYSLDKMDSSVTYDASGKIVETEVEIPVSALPLPALEYVKNNYKNNKVKKAYKITDANGIVIYKAEVKGVDLIFDSNCNFISAKN